ncbi:MAG: hypothetical protein C0407_00820 [Desulfobacca sp.]|nr:hypothetical protein [Desulfobacca sp.]
MLVEKLFSFHPEIRISGWKHLDFDMKLSPEILFKGFLAKEDSRQLYVLIRKGRFRMRTI